MRKTAPPVRVPTTKPGPAGRPRPISAGAPGKPPIVKPMADAPVGGRPYMPPVVMEGNNPAPTPGGRPYMPPVVMEGNNPAPTPGGMRDAPMTMRKGGAVKMASGGLASGHKAADGIAKRGKTKCKMY